jgi:hypothetical protein
MHQALRNHALTGSFPNSLPEVSRFAFFKAASHLCESLFAITGARPIQSGVLFLSFFFLLTVVVTAVVALIVLVVAGSNLDLCLRCSRAGIHFHARLAVTPVKDITTKLRKKIFQILIKPAFVQKISPPHMHVPYAYVCYGTEYSEHTQQP